MNLGQLRTALQALGYGTDTAAAQTSALNDAYRRVCGHRRWPFLEKQDTSITTTVGIGSYTLAGIADLLELDAVRIEQGANFIDLDYLPPQQFRDLEHADRVNDTPTFWSSFDGSLHFYPRPERAYLVTIDYIYDPPDLVADTDTPVIPATYHDVLVWGAAVNMSHRERDWWSIQMREQNFETRLREMTSTAGIRQRQTARSVIRSQVWDNFERLI